MESLGPVAPRSTGWQLRRRRTQGEIVKKAMLLFETRGYEATTVKEIAAACLISPRTFYRYFAAKEDVVFHGFPDSVELLRREARGGSGDLLDRLRTASVTLAGVLEKDKEAWIRRFDLILRVPTLRARDVVLNERYIEVYRDAMVEEWGGGAATERRSRLLAGAIMGGIQTAIGMWVESGGRPSLPSLANTVFDALQMTGRSAGDLHEPVPTLPEPTSSPPPVPKRPASRPGAGLDFFD